ncbi:hypothetical protein ANN_11290 [Periplaneta americana]|uniref:Per a allergen n=1 Tax=Periplaneta americana TaxID=6978 RepID=A0ABQ8T6W4_PERAM|nr:hypothetical protein ANN_11290 [Periplaneta americana]
MSQGSSTESYPAFVHIGLTGKPRKKPQPGRPQLRWLDEVEKDIIAAGVRGWKTKCHKILLLDQGQWSPAARSRGATASAFVIPQLYSPWSSNTMRTALSFGYPIIHRIEVDYNEEVHGISQEESCRGIDMLAIPPDSTSAYIIDPTVKFEAQEQQLAEVDAEKCRIYKSTIPCYLEKYYLTFNEVVELMAVARA